MRRNPLSTKQKLLAVGGLAVVGGVAAYALVGSGAAAGGGATGSGAAAGPDPAALAAQCAQLQQQLVQMKAAASPDQPSISRIETQVAQCIQQTRAAGGNVDNAMSNMSDADQDFEQIENWFNEYKSTDYSDALKRNNIRKNMLDTGQAMAGKYASAAGAATDVATANAVRQSILRALDSAVSRRICYQYDASGCGRFGANEDHGNDKAAQEQSRTIQPLLDAHGLSVQKIGSFGSSPLQADNINYARITLAPAAAASDWANQKFAQYKTIDYSDALNRNNTRSDMRGSAVESVNDLNAIIPDLTAPIYATLSGLQKAEAIILTALDRAYSRWVCFLTAASGCDRFGVNEDASDAKAGQEWTQTVVPLQNLYAQVSASLARFGDDGYKPYIALRVRTATSLNDYVNAKFNEYKSVDYSDPVRRNNIRSVFMSAGQQLAGFLAGTMSIAVDASNAAQTQISVPLLVTAATVKRVANLLGPTTFSATPTSGLGAAATPAPAPAVATQIDKNGTLIRQVIVVINTALASANARWSCFEIKGAGCDQSGTSEASNFDKAAWELSNVISPLLVALTVGYAWLGAHGDANAERDLTTAKLSRCIAGHQLAVSKWAEVDSINADPVRKANADAHARQIEQDVLACLRALSPTSQAGAQLVANTIQAWKTEYKSYPAGMDDLLAQWKSAGGMSGLGQVDNGAVVPLLLAVAVAGVLIAVSSHERPRSRKNTRRRRTSRRAR